jgi:hypothetical protein
MTLRRPLTAVAADAHPACHLLIMDRAGDLYGLSECPDFDAVDEPLRRSYAARDV